MNWNHNWETPTHVGFSFLDGINRSSLWLLQEEIPSPLVKWASKQTDKPLAKESDQAWEAKSFTCGRGRSGSASKPKLLSSVQPSTSCLRQVCTTSGATLIFFVCKLHFVYWASHGQHFVPFSLCSLTTQRNSKSRAAASHPSKWKCGTDFIKHLGSVKATLTIWGGFQQ